MKIQITENKYSNCGYNSLLNNVDSEAQNTLGEFYFTGMGVPQHHTKALDLFQQSAEQNNRNALYNLGVMFYRGVGVTRCIKTAFDYFSKSAALEHELSQLSLAILYRKGEGIDQDDSKAFELFKKVANSGNQQGQNYFTKCLFLGIGCESNPDKSFKLLTKFATGTNDISKLNLAIILSGVYSFNCSAIDTIEENSIKAFDLLTEVAITGNRLAQSLLSEHYDLGVGCEQNSDLANKWLMKAVNQECPYAEYLHAQKLFNYIDTHEVKQSKTEHHQHDCYGESHWSESYQRDAMMYIQKSAFRGCKNAQLQLSKWFGKGEVNGKKDYALAYTWSAIAIALGFDRAMDTRDEYMSYLSTDELNKAQNNAAAYFEMLMKRDMNGSQLDGEYFLELY